jgi:2-C-methyl-D-erythritol 4-phosphate cytidylyltransferase
MNAAIIVAGGRGTRMGADIPKQLLLLGGKTILEHTLHPFLRCAAVGSIVVTVAEDILEKVEELVRDLEPAGRIAVVRGGAERQESVWNGLSALPGNTGVVAVHDAVRPFITPRLIGECIDTAALYGAVTVARSVKETVKVVENGVVVETLDRDRLRLTQTPQAFRTDVLVRAHKRAREEGFTGTDDCMLVERLGLPVHVIEGTDMNIKITTPADLLLAGAILPLFECGDEAC